MGRSFLIICMALMILGLAWQVREFVVAGPERRASMRTGLVIQTVAVVVLTALNIRNLMS